MSSPFRNRSEYWGFYKKNAKLEVCFAKDLGQCSNKISLAHSLQKTGVLSKIEDDRQGGKKLYSLEEWLTDEKDQKIIDLKLVGKKSASIFSGFCDKHDSSLFTPIEQNPFELTEKQLFLYYYRGFAHSHHTVAEQCKFKKHLLDNFTPRINSIVVLRDAQMFALEYKVFLEFYNVGMKVKSRLNKMLTNADYSSMKHYYRIVPYTRIASSQCIVPSFTYDDVSLKRSESLSQIVLSIIPDTTRSVIVFSFFNDDKKGIQFVESIQRLPDKEFTHAVSSAVGYSGMNTYFSPDLWDSFNQEQRQGLIDDINYLIHKGHKHSSFFHSKIDFFSRGD